MDILPYCSEKKLLGFILMPWRRKWQPTPVFLPGESQGQRSLVGCRLWGQTVWIYSCPNNVCSKSSLNDIGNFVKTHLVIEVWAYFWTFIFTPLFSMPIFMPIPGFPGGDGKEPACRCRRCTFVPWVGKIPWRSAWQPSPIFLPGESHEQRSLVGYSPWGCKESDTTEWLSIAYITYLKST